MVVLQSDEDLPLGPERPSQGAMKRKSPTWDFESIPGQFCKLGAHAKNFHGTVGDLAINNRPNGKHCQPPVKDVQEPAFDVLFKQSMITMLMK